MFTPVLDGTPAVAPAALTPATVVLRELQSVSIDRIALNVDEGGSAVYTVALTWRPTGTVTVTPQVTGDMDVTVTPTMGLTFTGSSWNLPQRVTVRAAQDADDEDDTATVSHLVSGADYAGVEAGDVRVAVEDDDKSFGVMAVRLSDGAEGADTRAPAPAAHDGDTFHITLWWSGNVLRTDDFLNPSQAIGADRAIRVTGARVRPVLERGFEKWTQSRLRLELTPEDAETDVELVLEPLGCSYPDDLGRPDPNPHALCAWPRRGGRVTGLAERVRWTVLGLGRVPEAPRNLTMEEDEIPTVTESSVTGRAPRAGGGLRRRPVRLGVACGSAGGGRRLERGPEVRSGAKQGNRHRVRLDGLDPDGAWDVRVRWTNRAGTGPWAEAGTTGGPPLAAPAGLGLAQGADGQSVTFTWTPSSSAARYQYRLRSFRETTDWEDIPDSGPGAANRGSFTVDGLERTWAVGVRLRAVDRSGRAGAASAEARVPDAAPAVLAERIRVTSNPGADGWYAGGDRIWVGVKMSRPVRLAGGVAGAGDDPRHRRADAGGDVFAASGSPTGRAAGSRATARATRSCSPMSCRRATRSCIGIGIPLGGLDLNGADLVDTSAGGSGRAATFRLGRALAFRGHRVQGAGPQVETVEWLGNRVWVHFSHDLDPSQWRLPGSAIEQQFVPEFSKSTDGRVTDARIVRGRGWSHRCGRTETSCRTVRLTVAVRKQRGGTRASFLYGAPLPDERVEIRYVPVHETLRKYWLRDVAGNDGGAVRPASGAAPGAGRRPDALGG